MHPKCNWIYRTLYSPGDTLNKARKHKNPNGKTYLNPSWFF